ncbi:MAG: hypothetical protein AAGA86_09920 [Bacteroidota bacterium]
MALALVLWSCDNEDDTTTPLDAESLIGEWTLISLEADIDLETNVFQLVPINSSTTSVGENFDYDLTLTETEYHVEGGYDLVTTATLNGESIGEDRQTISDTSLS